MFTWFFTNEFYIKQIITAETTGIKIWEKEAEACYKREKNLLQRVCMQKMQDIM